MQKQRMSGQNQKTEGVHFDTPSADYHSVDTSSERCKQLVS
jgi:hypothetical protein